MNISRIKETCLYVADLQLTKEFYSWKLKLPVISFSEGRHVFFAAGQSVLLCFIAEKTQEENILPPHGASGSIHFAFEVQRNTYDETLEEIKEADIEILHQHVWKGKLRSFYFHDPDGHLIEIIEEGLWDADTN